MYQHQPHSTHHNHYLIIISSTYMYLLIYVIIESRAIARYIDARAGAKLSHYNNLDEWGRVETWASIEGTQFDKYASGMLSSSPLPLLPLLPLLYPTSSLYSPSLTSSLQHSRMSWCSKPLEVRRWNRTRWLD